jgi:hypothetical protein
MIELSFSSISHIRRALQSKLGHLKWTLEQDDKKALPEPLTAEARQQIQEDMLYYKGLINTFETAEKQSFALREVASICVPEGREGDPG